MLIALKVLKVVFILLFVLNSLVWLIAQGSGHNIPPATNRVFGIRSAAFMFLAAAAIVFEQELIKRKQA